VRAQGIRAMSYFSAIIEQHRKRRPTAGLASVRQEGFASFTSESRGPERGHQRLAIELDVDLDGGDGPCQGFSENLSRGGMFVATHLVKAVGSSVEFCIHLPDGFEPVRGVGEVRWIRAHDEWSDVPPGVGILFVRLDPGCADTLAHFVSNLQLMVEGGEL